MGWFVRYAICSAICIGAVWFATPRVAVNLKGKSMPEVVQFFKDRIQGKPVVRVENYERSADGGLRPLDSDAAKSARGKPREKQGAAARAPSLSQQPVATNYVTQTLYEQPDGSYSDTPPPEVEGNPWGVVAENTKCYTSHGDPITELAGGTVIEKISEHNSSMGAMYCCNVLVGDQWKERIFIPGAALMVFDQPLAATRDSDRDLIVRYYTIRGRLEARRQALREASIKANPHFDAYQKAAKAYMDAQERGKELVKLRDSSTGKDKAKYSDELRRMKGEEIQLTDALKRAEGPYKKWKESHPAESVDTESDAQVAELRRQLNELQRQVEGITGSVL